MMYTLIDELIAAAKAETAESVIEEARWCQFCGDELECFGCQVMPERNMEEQVKILKSKYNLPTTEQEGKGEK